MIKPDIAPFIHNHRTARIGRIAQYGTQQRGLATTKKACDDRNRNHDGAATRARAGSALVAFSA